MQRKGNIIARKNQGEKLVTVGIDMGGLLWATSVRDWTDDKEHYYGLKNKTDRSKEKQLFEKVKELTETGNKVEVFYEAGRYGYWPARIMKEIGAEVHILPINKMKVVMCGKVIKTDKLDAKFLGGLHPDDKLPEVYIPTLEEEGRRDAERELQRLKTSICRANDQIIGILERTPLETPCGHRNSKMWMRYLEKEIKKETLKKIPVLMIKRLKNLVEELEVFEKHSDEWEKTITERMEKDRVQAEVNGEILTADKLKKFKGIGEIISRHFAWEIGDFKRFGNGKKFASYFGLTPCPYSSGTMSREQGISKSGRKSLRKTAVELAWLWVKWQPESFLTKKWMPKLSQKGRARRTAIVALARQLLVALWRHIVHDEPVAGAIIKTV